MHGERTYAEHFRGKRLELLTKRIHLRWRQAITIKITITITNHGRLFSLDTAELIRRGGWFTGVN